ncbi:MAG: twin-arginine translocation signal domain-containing protein [Syntrophorhabdales bacterium]|jgi:anaerobic selenocysteine-containing dehydrogenase
MKKPEDVHSMNRRDFLKAGMAGAAAASIGLSGMGSLLYAQVPTAPVVRRRARTVFA